MITGRNYPEVPQLSNDNHSHLTAPAMVSLLMVRVLRVALCDR